MKIPFKESGETGKDGESGETRKDGHPDFNEGNSAVYTYSLNM